MRGQLLWFNQAKHMGAIRADDGRRLEVRRSGFRPGHAPLTRCAGIEVSFSVVDDEGEPGAVDVELVAVVAPRRARRRRRGGA